MSKRRQDRGDEAKPLPEDGSAARFAYDHFEWWSKAPGDREVAKKEFEALPKEARGRLLDALRRCLGGETRAQDLERVDGDIWAIRVRGGNNQFRMLFLRWGSTMVILTAFYKNQKKLERGDIERAKGRAATWRATRGDKPPAAPNKK